MELAKQRAAGSGSEHMDTLVAHSGVESHVENAPMAAPIHMATTYTRPADGEYLADDYIYSRNDNPTRLLLENEVGLLECRGKTVGTESPIVSCAFSSGMMAVSSILLAHSAPTRVLMPHDLYHGVPTVCLDVFTRFGVTTQRVDMMDPAAVCDAIDRAPGNEDVIVWIESPSNPQCQVIDIHEMCRAVRQTRNAKLTVVVDSTMAPPTITQPLLLGADISMHSGTKYLGGHSDALLGIATASPWTSRGAEIGPRLKQVQIAVGGVASAMDSWLTLRGLRTLAVRVSRQSKTALHLATFLEEHPLVEEVHYPGLVSHPNHDVAKIQMKTGAGGVLSLEMPDENRAMALAGALLTIKRATSLGGTESVIEHRASIEPEGRKVSPPGLLRLSVGLEDADDLVADLDRALLISEAVCSGNA